MLHLTLIHRKCKDVRICICENYVQNLIAKLYTNCKEIFIKKMYNNL
jgi:hypothetical protein